MYITLTDVRCSNPALIQIAPRHSFSNCALQFTFCFLFRNESTDDNTIDLHGLHVTEAIEALERMLTERTGTFVPFV